jgi:hypothetical protein
MSTGHTGNEGTCWNDHCPRCRSIPAQDRDREFTEHKRRLKSADWADDSEYTPEERLTNLRIEGVRRRGMSR